MKCLTSSIIVAILGLTFCAAADPQMIQHSDPALIQLSEPPPSVAVDSCPADMIEVSGDYCPNVEQVCLNLDMTVHNANGYVRCIEYAPSICRTPEEKRPHLHFCIDRYEYPNQKGVKPTMMITWYDSKKDCESIGKRLCTDTEWTQACEGPKMLPYPYGYKRDKLACNIDNLQRPWFDASKSKMTPEIAAKLDQSVPAGSMPACVSPYGVYDMTGNSDEWVVNTSGHPYVSGLKGGHWVLGARNRCRPETIAHGPDTIFYELGTRCCGDIK
jgi:formylglycine-generating enzyme required for sulfatase activity